MASDKTEKNDDYIPFGLRFKAWWNGVSAAQILAAERAKQESSDDKSNPNDIIVDEIEEEEPGVVWSNARLRLCNRLWGGEDAEEVVLPGGTQYTLDLSKPMGLDSSKTLLDLCAGQGGGTRRIAKEFQLWVEGMESDPVLAEKANELSAKHGMDKKAPVAHFDPDSIALREGRYDGILMRESMFKINNKQHMLNSMFKALKPRGHLIITDLVYKQENSEEHKTVEAWRKAYAPLEPKLWTMADYKKAVLDLSMDLHIHDEQTDEYNQMVLSGWAHFVEGLKKEELNRQFVSLMMEEAQYWLRLTRAFDAGEILFMRIHATRGGESI